MKLPKEWEAIISACMCMPTRHTVERCYALTQKPVRELTDAEIQKVICEEGWDGAEDALKKLLKAAIAAHQRKQTEPEFVEFRAARNKTTGKILMFGGDVGPRGTLGTDWEWHNNHDGSPITVKVPV